MKSRRLLLLTLLTAVVLLLTVGIQPLFAQAGPTPLPTGSPAPTATPTLYTPITGSVATGAATHLTGTGSTFAAVDYTAAAASFAQITGIEPDYQSTGSGAGIKAMGDGSVNFAGTDSLLTADQTTAAEATCGGPLLVIPTALGAVTLTYNLTFPDVPALTKPLRFSPATVAGIFLGKINVWNDPAILADNPDLPDLAKYVFPIAVVTRADSSGTTKIMTSYLSAINSDWANGPGAGTTVTWPIGFGQKGSGGIAGAVANLPGSIGYVELIYALQSKLAVADIQNSSGNFITPSTASVTAAGALAKTPQDIIVNSAAPDAYPISGFTWLLVCSTQKDQGVATSVALWSWYLTHDVQPTLDGLGYAPLPLPLMAQVDKLVLDITYDGKQALPDSIAKAAG